MTDPVFALFAGLAVVVALTLLLWPDRGLLWRLVRMHRATERVQIEDALKHLFDCEYLGHPSTLASTAGALRVSGGRAAELLERMQQQELVVAAESGFRLTPTGRSDALRVVRIHRLWERYLSEETGLAPQHWHERAEELEHRTSRAQAEALSQQMGHPLYDPHGDPIPTPSGDIAPRRGQPLNSLPVGQLAEIVHVEDEPPTIFAQLVAEGLQPGMRVRVFEATPERIRFEADAEEYVLAPVIAANLSVVELTDDDDMTGPFERLSQLQVGEQADVVGFLPLCRGPERRRLMDLGLIPGTTVAAEIQSPAGDPTGYRIRGAIIALRKVQADQIQIEHRRRSGSPADDSSADPVDESSAQHQESAA